VLADAVFGDGQQIGDVLETRTPGQFGSDVRQRDFLDRIDFDLALVHAVAAADLDVGMGPESDAAGDPASSHSLAELLGEDHVKTLVRRSLRFPRGQTHQQLRTG
jgi:hypothetical protein